VVQNNGGGHVNHSMFWQIMKPKGGGDPSGAIARRSSRLRRFRELQELFNETTAKQFGSGWGWLVFKAVSSPSSPRPTRTTRSRPASTRSWAMTSGSTPTTSSTRTSGQTILPRGGAS